MTNEDNKRILRIRDLIAMISISRSTIYRLIDRNDFPKGFKLADNATGWLKEDIDKWIEDRKNRTI